MDFRKKSGDPQLERLRMAIVKTMPRAGDPESGIGNPEDLYWEAEIRDCIAERRYETAYHYLQLAAFGEGAFTGTDRICRGHVEGQPTDFVCTPGGLTGLVQLLYFAMSHGSGKVFAGPVDPFREVPAWGELFPSGNRLAQHLYRQHSLPAFIAGLQVLAIADWANNYRRLAYAA